MGLSYELRLLLLLIFFLSSFSGCLTVTGRYDGILPLAWSASGRMMPDSWS